MRNRLQFRHHSAVFKDRRTAIDYIYNTIRNNASGITSIDGDLKRSLFAEPTVLRYHNEEDDSKVTSTPEEIESTGVVEYSPNDLPPSPHIILAIGSDTNERESLTYEEYNRYCIIDIDKTEEEISNLQEEIERVIEGLKIITKETNTLTLYSGKNSNGNNIISGDVRVAESHVFDDRIRPNSILSTDNGLFTFVKLELSEDKDKFTFIVNDEITEVPLNDYYITGGCYSKKDESLHLHRKDGEDIKISLEKLIGEWTTEGEYSPTPIVLTREEVGHDGVSEHYHVKPWQDILKADIRISDSEARPYNILKKDFNGRYLYVDGTAENIHCVKDGEECTVQDVLNRMKGSSNDSTNIIYEKLDGYYATASLKYNNKKNRLTFTTSNVTGGTTSEVIQLNTVEFFKEVHYDTATETLVIIYSDGSGEVKTVEVPIGELLVDWEWDIQNEGHNVKLEKTRVTAGNDKVSADVEIYEDPDNILLDKNHQLFVKGTADNIRYGNESNVASELEKLNTDNADINSRLNETSGKTNTLRSDLDSEITRSTNKDEELRAIIDAEVERSIARDTEQGRNIDTINNKIGDGFTTDGHETITYKFNELSANTNTISSSVETVRANVGLLSAKIEGEIARATDAETSIERDFKNQIGEGFNIRNTVRDELDKEKSDRETADNNILAKIDVVSSNTEAKLSEIINNDHSINVDNTNQAKPIVKVNISEETIDGLDNAIRLNNDGLYVGVDLDYQFTSGTSENVLVFKVNGEEKRFNLQTNSVVDKIYYNASSESIVIEYTVNGRRMQDVVIPVGDLIDEWRVSEDTSGAIRLTKSRESGVAQDVLSAETIISAHEDNILINDNGALYVSRKPISDLEDRVDSIDGSVDSVVNDLAAEITRATAAENTLQSALGEAEGAISQLDGVNTVQNENIAQLRTDLNNEITRSTNKDNELTTSVNTLGNNITAETTRATNTESSINTRLDTISGNLDGEIANRIQGDTDLRNLINANSLTFDDTNTIDLNKSDSNVLTANVKVANSNDNIIKVDGERAGLYASVQLVYDAIENKIKLSTSAGEQQAIQLNAGSVLDSASYDSVNRNLILTYKDAQGISHSLTIPVNEIVNEWDVANPSERSAVELTKTIGTEGNPDKISARVIISGLEDNILKFDSNGLYVSGSGIARAEDSIECVSNKLGSVEKAVFGHSIADCGEGYEYEKHNTAKYINSATSIDNATELLDSAVGSVSAYAQSIESMIAGLTQGSETTTVSLNVGDDNKIYANLRLSHGSENTMTDEDFVITDASGFTNTNILSKVEITDSEPDNPLNGLYLSNVWDCGEYTGDDAVGTSDLYNAKYKNDVR